MTFKILIPLVVSAAFFFVIALGLILSQRPQAIMPGAGLDFTAQLAKTGDPAPLTSVAMGDGYALQHRVYPGARGDAPLVVLVHGSGWHGMQFDGLARALQGAATVIVPDLRGHGAKPGVRGDIAYVDQFEDDLAVLIGAYAQPGQKVVLGGHSSGGGLVVRFAGGAHGGMLDGAVLMAPFLKYNAPTSRENSGGWAQPLTRRIIGLSMLNMVGIKALNHLTILQFRMPKVVMDGPLGHTATTAYSYRLNTGFSPRANYGKDIAALPSFVLIAGSEDEAFHAARFEPVMGAHTDAGRYVLVPGVGHLDIVDQGETVDAIKGFLDGI